MINKKELVKILLQESGAKPEDEPAAFFMAGLPGSGKTEISKNLIKDSGVKLFRIDMDEIAETLPGYAPEKADEFRKPATAILSSCLSYALHNHISFLLDGTFGSPQALKNIERSLAHGFSVQIIYALQDPKLAWQFTIAREKVEHLAIEFNGFISAYYRTIYNLQELIRLYEKRIAIDIVIKDENNKIGDWLHNVSAVEFDEITKIEYNKDKLISYIIGEQ